MPQILRAKSALCVPGRVENGGESATYQASVELLWKNYFKDPTAWWDNRKNKLHQKSPDFRHKVTKEGLWVDSWSTPRWVATVLGTESLSNFADEGRVARDSTSSQEGQYPPGNAALMAPQRTEFSWTALMLQHTKSGQPLQALKAYEDMKECGVKPISYTFVAALKACSVLQDLESARKIHAEVVECGCESDIYVGTTLVDVYGKCGRVSDARSVFEKMPHRTVVSWNAMILGYAQTEKAEMALELYSQMKQEGSVPNARTFVAALRACSGVAYLKERTEGDGIVGKKQILEQVRVIHAEGHAEMEEGEVALQLYTEMQQQGVVPDLRAFVAALKACGSVAALDKGKEIHAEILKTEVEITDHFVAASLIDMYGKCGSMHDAHQVFDLLVERDAVTWSALISGYARQGESALVFDLFQRMKQEGIKPDKITFLSLLTVCSRAGLVDKGEEYLEAMSRDYGVTPTTDHYNCMVDLLGRVGQLDKAMAIARSVQSSGLVWKTVLAACQKWGNVQLGRQAFQYAVTLDKNDTAAYILMWNIYQAACMLEGAKEIEAMRVKTGAMKTRPGQSWWTDMVGIVHTFGVRDQEHPASQGLYAKLRDLLVKMEENGSC